MLALIWLTRTGPDYTPVLSCLLIAVIVWLTVKKKKIP